jgi:hypothetical protein
VGKVIPISDRTAKAAERREAIDHAYLLFEVLPRLVPRAGVAEKRKLVADIMMVLKNRRTRMRPQLLEELLRIHSSCVHDQEGKCGLLLSVSSLNWEINNSLGIGNEEDRGFKRHDPMCAARPLTVRFDREEE